MKAIAITQARNDNGLSQEGKLKTKHNGWVRYILKAEPKQWSAVLGVRNGIKE